MMSTGIYRPHPKKYKFKLDFSNIYEFAGLTGFKINKIVSELAGSTTTTYDNSSSTSYTSLSTTPSTSPDQHVRTECHHRAGQGRPYSRSKGLHFMLMS